MIIVKYRAFEYQNMLGIPLVMAAFCQSRIKIPAEQVI
jgi:hypothetical protein